ncbi:putative ribonuclease H-like domain-containing protein [Tanacetum coccineum]
MTHPSPKRNMVPKAVLIRSGLISLTTSRPVNTAQPKTTLNSARPMLNVFNKAHSTVRRPINNKTTTKNSNFNQMVNIVSGKNVNTARPKAVVNTAKPKAVLNVVKGNHVNAIMNYKPVVTGNQSNGNAGTKACDDAGKARMETVPGKDYILLPLWTADLLFSQKGDDPSKEDERDDQEKDASVNSTNNVNAARTNEVNVVGAKTSIVLPNDPNMPELEDIVYSDDDEDVSAEADMNNLDASMPVSPIPTTRAHKDHPNKERLVAQGYIQEEGIDYDEVFAPVARFKSIRLFLAYASFKDFVVYQMDVKSAFLYGKIEEEVYVCQPPGFEDPDFPDRVYKVEKAL